MWQKQCRAITKSTVPTCSRANLADSASKNLQIVDNLIAVCEKKVRENPYDPLAREYLYGAYQQKADLLSQLSERGGYGR